MADDAPATDAPAPAPAADEPAAAPADAAAAEAPAAAEASTNGDAAAADAAPATEAGDSTAEAADGADAAKTEEDSGADKPAGDDSAEKADDSAEKTEDSGDKKDEEGSSSINEGWLWKKGGGTSLFGKRNWKKRWVVVNGEGFMSYHEKKGGKPLKGVSMPLFGFTVAETADDPKLFAIAPPEGVTKLAGVAVRSFELKADKDEEREVWVAAFKKAAALDPPAEESKTEGAEESSESKDATDGDAAAADASADNPAEGEAAAADSSA